MNIPMPADNAVRDRTRRQLTPYEAELLDAIATGALRLTDIPDPVSYVRVSHAAHAYGITAR